METLPAVGLLATLAFLSTSTLEAAPKVEFEKQILPILKESCIDCHQAPAEVRGRVKKPKGGLRLDGARWIMRGGSGGEVVVKGKPEKSPLFKRIVLPPDDEDIMPPKGKPLAKKQASLIRQWIAEGAGFGGWKGNETGSMARAQSGNGKKTAIPATPRGQAVSEEALEQARKSGAVIHPVQVGSSLLTVAFTTSAGTVDDQDFSKLEPILANITELDLSRTKITDKSLQKIGTLPRLTYLNLRKTRTDDNSLKELKSLEYLSYLNLSGTRVTDSGLANLKNFKKLRSLYLWESKVTSAGMARLQKALPRARISR